MVAVRIHGLAWKVETQEVVDFFKDYKTVQDSVVLGQKLDRRLRYAVGTVKPVFLGKLRR